MPRSSGPGVTGGAGLYIKEKTVITGGLFDAASGGYMWGGCGKVSAGPVGGPGGRAGVCAVLRKNRGFGPGREVEAGRRGMCDRMRRSTLIIFRMGIYFRVRQ